MWSVLQHKVVRVINIVIEYEAIHMQGTVYILHYNTLLKNCSQTNILMKFLLCFRVWHQRISNMLPAVSSGPCTSEMSKWHGLMPVAYNSQSRTKMVERKRLLPSRQIILSSRKIGLLVSRTKKICINTWCSIFGKFKFIWGMLC